MSTKFIFHFAVPILLLMMVPPANAAGLDDADQRLFQVQLSVAQKGNARAQYYLGEMYEQGLGTTQNLDEAFKWYARAAQQGDALAKYKLAQRAEIEAEAKIEQNADTAKFVPASKGPALSNGTTANAAATKAPVAIIPQKKSQPDKEKIMAAQQAAEKAAEKEKRRAEVRAMVLERMRHPVGEPFE